MKIKSAVFAVSNTDYKKCPTGDLPEYAFIGRSNVGKSSLINMLTSQKNLAKTSGKPGKTQLINHFLINENWYIVDLPGYGYAKVAKSQREKFEKFIAEYLLNRQQLVNVFVLVDSRLDPQQIDLEFMNWCGEKEIPFSIVFTKIDKLSSSALQKNMAKYKKELQKYWAEIPPVFTSSSETGFGSEKILNYIEQINQAIAGNQ
ncbi:MAG TPA: ribosome biogenesis GTP-binding protein YihA/YsxC [Taishania sp.]|nr:ribosome biogenesis GTP-binding protein YihA/YsxC [Taishania sp.]HNS41600.1 ribosome biogenesis GTP-binding protein YihA/YsxC [Taishania sp.]